jgi:Plavaka transposase
MADYEEQVLITGVKSQQHCTICQVPPNRRENLLERHPLRTHESTKKQIAAQQANNTPQTDPDWVHPVPCFAWKHGLINIHNAMMADILHQLLKGIVMRLIEWIRKITSEVVPASKKRKRHRRTVQDISAESQIDQRFMEIPQYPGLKVFHDTPFSQISQWTGDEQKSILKQLIPALAPLLTSKAPYAMHFARATLDFVTMAQYRTHDEETLRYMEHALYRIDKLKGVFQGFRPRAKDSDEGHFNFPKFHAMTHFMDHIRQFGAADGYDTSNGEAAHKYAVKAYWNRTNKQSDFELQICLHNTRRVSVLATESWLLHYNSRTVSTAERSMALQLTKPTRHIDMRLTPWGLETDQYAYISQYGLGLTKWRTVGTLADSLEISDFEDALAVFLRECRRKVVGQNSTQADMDRRDLDPSWIRPYFIQVHPSLKCWKRTGADPNDLDQVAEEIVHCAPNWRKSGNWKRDYIWV